MRVNSFRIPQSSRVLRPPTDKQAFGAMALAFAAWSGAFLLGGAAYWYALCVAAVMMMALALYFSGWPLPLRDIKPRFVVTGVAGAVVLYGVFALGNWLVTVLPLPAPDAGDIYSVRDSGWFFVLCFMVISPAEEIFWRGFLQRWAVNRFGPLRGWLGAAFFYAFVHIASGNPLFIAAALVTGLFWGFIYLVCDSLVPVIICHALWTMAIFVVWPLF